MTDLDALTTLGSYAELWRRVQAAVLRWDTGPAKTTLGSESEPAIIETPGGSADASGTPLATAQWPPGDFVDCDSCGKACPPGTLGPDPDPECAGLWCGECVVAGERWREGKE